MSAPVTIREFEQIEIGFQGTSLREKDNNTNYSHFLANLCKIVTPFESSWCKEKISWVKQLPRNWYISLKVPFAKSNGSPWYTNDLIVNMSTSNSNWIHYFTPRLRGVAIWKMFCNNYRTSNFRSKERIVIMPLFLDELIMTLPLFYFVCQNVIGLPNISQVNIF